ncbi:MAG: hypothetical protein QOE55_5183 [Acidobacteriaceae bacterium]|jgi:hypothetical protein|nr:hypothetical protein [Acidobacteriaceae bacterium]
MQSVRVLALLLAVAAPAFKDAKVPPPHVCNNIDAEPDLPHDLSKLQRKHMVEGLNPQPGVNP